MSLLACPRTRVVAIALLFAAGLAAQPPEAQPTTSRLEQAFAELVTSPEDAYLQFAVLQLARREGKVDDYARRIEEVTRRRSERQEVDLFDLFTGAHAVQESLQLDMLRGTDQAAPLAEQSVEVASLEGPAVQSHPWTRLLAGRRPEVSPMSLLVPADFWLAEFRSLQKLLTLADRGDLWGSHFVHQAAKEARALDFGEHIRQQLAIETTPILRPFYDQVVESIALTGSDAYLREGTDLTLLFRLKQPQIFRARMQSFLEKARQLPGATSEKLEIAGIACEHVATPDRSVHVFAADPTPDLHVRGNSRAALLRVLAAIQGKDRVGRAVPRLGETDEMLYVRTLMPAGAAEEDGFVYLSDAFVRRLVGPEVKLKERRRLLCSVALRTVGHAALLHLSEHGSNAASLAALAESGCLPAGFGKGACPDGGTLSLAENGMSGRCSRHGQLGVLTPCLELPLTHVTPEEAEAYRGFVRSYNEYWRTYFDPIVLRIAVTAKSHRIETLVLPLIDNSIYTRLAAMLGGEPAPLGDAPLAKSSLLALGMKFDKRVLLQGIDEMVGDLRQMFGPGFAKEELQPVLEKGIGDRITLHVCDAEPLFDFSVPGFFGDVLQWSGRSLDFEELSIAFLIVALNAPVYATLDVQDPKIVDAFLDRLDAVLAARARRPDGGGRWWNMELDFYHFGGETGQKVRCARIGFGPLGWRLFWTRIENHVVVATKKTVLEDLLREPEPATPNPSSHALLRLRPQAWEAVRPDYELGWAENARRACLANLGPMRNLLRVVPAETRVDRDALAARLDALATTVYGARFYCPDGGDYRPDGERGCRCTVHGTLREPVQLATPAPRSEIGRMLRSFQGLSATLTFLPEGLRAVVEIEQR